MNIFTVIQSDVSFKVIYVTAELLVTPRRRYVISAVGLSVRLSVCHFLCY